MEGDSNERSHRASPNRLYSHRLLCFYSLRQHNKEKEMTAETRKTINLISSAMPHVTYCLLFVPCDLLLLFLGFPPNVKDVFLCTL